MNLNNTTIGSYVIVYHEHKGPKICKILSIGPHIRCLIQDSFCKKEITFYDWEKVEIKAIPFTIDILKMEKWEYDEELDSYKDPTKQITIQKNEELCPYPFSIHIDNSDADTIGRLNFTYFHELQSFCNICNVPISFRMGSIIYFYKDFI